MNCKRCDKPAPNKIISITDNWTCPDCARAPSKLVDVLKILYNSGVPGRYAYISELTNNLDKIRRVFIERQSLDNPYCVIYLSLPDGASYLQGKFDTIFVDSGFASYDDIAKLDLLDEFGEIVWINPTSQELDHDRY